MESGTLSVAISGTVAVVVEEGGALVVAFGLIIGVGMPGGVVLACEVATGISAGFSPIISTISHTTDPHIRTMAVANRMAGRRWRMSGEKLAHHRTGASSAFEMGMNFFNINLVAPLRFA